MMIRRIAGANVTFVAPGCFDLPARIEESDMGRVIATAWEPTPDELAALLSGGSIVLRVVGGGHPPVSLSVEAPVEAPVPAEA